MSQRPKRYPVQRDGKTMYVSVPGAEGPQPGPKTEAAFETFLAEAIETYAEASEIARPRIRTFADAGVLTASRGLVVQVGAAEFQITLVQSGGDLLAGEQGASLAGDRGGSLPGEHR
jgi:hypothetical protein